MLVVMVLGDCVTDSEESVVRTAYSALAGQLFGPNYGANSDYSVGP